MNKALFLLLLALLVVFHTYATLPVRTARTADSLLFVNPVLARALSGNFHTLLADRLWLNLGMVSETGAKGSLDVNTTLFYKTSKTLIFMDGNFFPAVAYSSTFLISLFNEIKQAHDLIHLARIFDPLNFKLYFLEIINIISYEHATPSMLSRVDYLGKKALAIPQEKRGIAIRDSTVWIEEALAFAQNDLARKQKQKEQLLWLLKQTKDPNQRALIRNRLEDLAQ